MILCLLGLLPGTSSNIKEIKAATKHKIIELSLASLFFGVCFNFQTYIFENILNLPDNTYGILASLGYIFIVGPMYVFCFVSALIGAIKAETYKYKQSRPIVLLAIANICFLIFMVINA